MFVKGESNNANLIKQMFPWDFFIYKITLFCCHYITETSHIDESFRFSYISDIICPQKGINTFDIYLYIHQIQKRAQIMSFICEYSSATERRTGVGSQAAAHLADNTHSAGVVHSTSHSVVMLRGRPTLGPYESFRMSFYVPASIEHNLYVRLGRDVDATSYLRPQQIRTSGKLS